MGPPADTPDPDAGVVFAARDLALADARITDTPVTLLADQLSQSAGDPGLTVAYSHRAQDSVPQSHGTVVPDVPGVESTPASTGGPGFPLTALVRELGNSSAMSRAQTGGQGKWGRDEIRSICETYPATPKTLLSTWTSIIRISWKVRMAARAKQALRVAKLEWSTSPPHARF